MGRISRVQSLVQRPNTGITIFGLLVWSRRPKGSLIPLLAGRAGPSTIDSRDAENLFLFKKSNKVQAREFSSLQRFFFKQ